MINGPSPSLGRSPNIRSCDLIPSRWPTAHVHTLPSSSQLITHFLSATVNSTPTGAGAIHVLMSLVSQTQPTRGERTVGDKREVLWKYVHASLLHMGMDFGEYRGALSSTLGDLFKQCVSTGPLLFSYLHAPGHLQYTFEHLRLSPRTSLRIACIWQKFQDKNFANQLNQTSHHPKTLQTLGTRMRRPRP